MGNISFAEFEQYVDTEDRLWHMGKEFFAEIQTHRPECLPREPFFCHYDDVYVDGVETLEIGYECAVGNDYDLFMIEVPVVEFLDDHITAAHNIKPLTYGLDEEAQEQLEKSHKEIDEEFVNFEY